MSKRYGGGLPFHERLARATTEERAVAAFLEERGRRCTLFSNLPPSPRGGPRLHTLDAEHVAPDLLIVHPRSGRSALLDVKARANWTWHRASRCWQTGAELEYLHSYLGAEAAIGLRCWIAFLFASPTFDADAPAPAPDGLFAARCRDLDASVDHVHAVGRQTMAYWPITTLCRIASAAAVRAAAARRGV